MHTNDAATAIPRLIDLGAEPFLIASVLVAVVLGFYVKSRNEYAAVSSQLADKHMELARLRRLVANKSSTTSSLSRNKRPIPVEVASSHFSSPVDSISYSMKDSWPSFPGLSSVSMSQDVPGTFFARRTAIPVKPRWLETQPFTLKKGQFAELPESHQKLHLKDILYSPCSGTFSQCTWSGVGAIYDFNQKTHIVKKPLAGFPVSVSLDNNFVLEVLDIQPTSSHSILKMTK